MEKERERMEEEKENRRLEEQRLRMQSEYDEEQKKIRAREEEVGHSVHLKVLGMSPYIFASFTKDSNFYDFLFASLDIVVLLKGLQREQTLPFNSRHSRGD